MNFQAKVFKETTKQKIQIFNPRITWAELFFTALGTALGIGLLAFLRLIQNLFGSYHLLALRQFYYMQHLQSRWRNREMSLGDI